MNKTTILLRSIARRLGLTRLVRAILPARDYEQAFSDRMMSSIRAGDVVWDIGANVGVYTLKFMDAVQGTGSVVAFEPSPQTARLLQQNVEKSVHRNAKVVTAAIGDFNGTAPMLISEAATSPTNRLCVEHDSDDGRTVTVPVYTGDSIRQQMQLPIPAIIKIDVEGFEKECLDGMPSILSDPQLRAVFVEIHFGILEQRGMRFVPAAIERCLVEKGLQVTWVDSSHIAATRHEHAG